MRAAVQNPALARSSQELAALARRGVVMPAPEQVFIAQDVPLEAVAAGAVLHPFTRLAGAATRVDAGAVIGASGPATLENAWVGAGAVVGRLGPVTLRDSVAGPGAVLGSGVAEHSVFLGREGDAPEFTTGYGFRARPGTLYEEGANSAQHTDTKMTVLLPWVTLGSNLNWCDILVAGGRGPDPGCFTEIGSGVIHFNFTPRGDKATGSMLGDVREGVFLQQARLFIGGNVSLIGPVTADFGAATPAGGRHAGRLRMGMNPPLPPLETGALGEFDLEVYGSVSGVYQSQVRMIGELSAMAVWYEQVRKRLAHGDADRAELYRRGGDMVRLNLNERIKQLTAFAGRVEGSLRILEARRPGDPRIGQQRALVERWPKVTALLAERIGQAAPPPPELLRGLEQTQERLGRVAYTAVIQALPAAAAQAGRHWMARVSDAVTAGEVLSAVPRLTPR